MTGLTQRSKENCHVFVCLVIHTNNMWIICAPDCSGKFTFDGTYSIWLLGNTLATWILKKQVLYSLKSKKNRLSHFFGNIPKTEKNLIDISILILFARDKSHQSKNYGRPYDLTLETNIKAILSLTSISVLMDCSSLLARLRSVVMTSMQLGPFSFFTLGFFSFFFFLSFFSLSLESSFSSSSICSFSGVSPPFSAWNELFLLMNHCKVWCNKCSYLGFRRGIIRFCPANVGMNLNAGLQSHKLTRNVNESVINSKVWGFFLKF